MREKNPKPRVSAVILAAGKSSRMGTPKQLLPVGAGEPLKPGEPREASARETLLGRVVENVRRSRVEEIVVVLGHAAEEIRKQIPLEGVRVVVNEDYPEGMGSSLRAGLGAVDPAAEAALIVLADQPFVRPATLDRLIERYVAEHPQIAIPVYEGFRGNPVLLDRSVFPEVMQLRGDIGCRAIFGSHLENILKVPVGDAGILADIDEANDLEKLRSFAERGEAERVVLEAVDLAGRDLPAAGGAAAQGPELVLVGREAVSLALARLARVVRFRVTLVDPLLAPEEAPEADHVLRALDFSRLPANPDRYVVVASRGKFDEEAVEQALEAQAAYVALVSRKARAQEILRSLALKGISDEKLASVHAPAGLDIGAEGPEEIALSILAEIVAERRRRMAGAKQPQPPPRTD
jgi:molybdenum cofactor cytidylyltransferase